MVKHTFYEQEDHPASQSVQDALRFRKNYWLSVWSRPLPDPHVAREFINQYITQSHATRWEPLTVQDMLSAAKKKRSRAAGIDGWHGDEIFVLPLSFWISATPLFNEFGSS